jgi:hypothetical protein
LESLKDQNPDVNMNTEEDYWNNYYEEDEDNMVNFDKNLIQDS